MKKIALVTFLGLSLLPYEFINGMNLTQINARDCNGGTALHKAVQEGNISEVQSLLSQGVDPNLQNRDGYSAFCIAVQQGNPDLVKALFDKGAKVNPDGGVFTTPLIVAVEEFCKDQTNIDRLNIVKFLLQNGADPNIRPDGYRDTAIDIALYNENLDLLRLLFDYKADVNTHGPNGYHLLHCAVALENPDVVELLLSKKANPNATNASGDTPVHLAARQKNAKILQLLLDNGGDPKALDYKQNTPLHSAENAEIVKILLQKDVDINAKNADGVTPLHAAAIRGDFASIQALVDSGADITATNNAGAIPLVKMIYTLIGNKEFDIGILNRLCTKETKLPYDRIKNAIHFCAREKSNNKLLGFILSKTSDFKNNEGVSALCNAINGNNLEGVEILIKHGVDLNAKTHLNGDTPLHVAVSEYRIEAIKFLVYHGADITITNKYGKTPIHKALTCPYKEKATNMIKIMLERQEVNVNSQEEVSNYMQINFEDRDMISRVRSLLFPKKSKKRKVSF